MADNEPIKKTSCFSGAKKSKGDSVSRGGISNSSWKVIWISGGFRGFLLGLLLGSKPKANDEVFQEIFLRGKMERQWLLFSVTQKGFV